MADFFTADLHLGHEKIIQYCNRPFASAVDMDDAIVSRWNKKVKPHDTVWIIGDVSFSSAQRTLEIITSLNGHLKLIPGNHDARLLKDETLKSLFDIQPEIVDRKFNTTHVVMCHYPLMSWNRAYHGAFHLHGHTHGNIPFDKKFRRLDVGVDVHDFTPIAWGEVMEILSDAGPNK